MNIEGACPGYGNSQSDRYGTKHFLFLSFPITLCRRWNPCHQNNTEVCGSMYHTSHQVAPEDKHRKKSWQRNSWKTRRPPKKPVTKVENVGRRQPVLGGRPRVDIWPLTEVAATVHRGGSTGVGEGVEILPPLNRRATFLRRPLWTIPA